MTYLATVLLHSDNGNAKINVDYDGEDIFSALSDYDECNGTAYYDYDVVDIIPLLTVAEYDAGILTKRVVITESSEPHHFPMNGNCDTIVVQWGFYAIKLHNCKKICKATVVNESETITSNLPILQSVDIERNGYVRVKCESEDCIDIFGIRPLEIKDMHRPPALNEITSVRL